AVDRRRRVLQRCLPLGPVASARRLPLARAPAAEADHAGRLRDGHRRAPERDAAGARHPGAARHVTRIRVTTVIRAPRSQVWAAIRDIARHVDWMEDAGAIRFTWPRTSGVGTTFD